MTNDSARHDAALDWLVRTNDPEFDAWDDFTGWLEEDPANSDAYHALVQSEADLLPLVEATQSSRQLTRKLDKRWLALGPAAVAAALALIVAPRAMPVDYQTGPGEVRIVSLGGRDQLVMNGETELQLAGFDRRTVRLKQGQVLLRMLEPNQDKIAVLSGDLRLVDVGTIFEVTRVGPGTRVLVSEGAVIADPGGAGLKLAAGQRLDTSDGASVLRAAPADTASVGSFERGQLTYYDEPVENVVADLRRSTGLDISTSAAIRSLRFSGTLSVPEVKRDPQSLEPLLGVSMERSGQGWKLEGRA